MFKTYLKTAWRRLIKDRTHSIINISGLAIGIAVVLVIGFWIWDELSFDIYNTNYKTIGQIARKEISKSEVYIAAGNNHFPIPLADELRRNYQNVFSHVSLSSDRSSHIVIFNDIHRSVSGIFAEKDFTNIFTLKLTAGSAAGFSDPNSILLSQSVAQSLFGRTSAVGKIIKLDNTQPLKVIGIFEDLPFNNSLSGVGFLCPFDLLVNIEPWVKGVLNDWSNSSFFLYTQVQPGMSDKDISNVIRDVYWSKIKNSVAQIPIFMQNGGMASRPAVRLQ
jgi:putative ABC transport system permease protein